MRTLLILFSIIFSFSNLQASEVSEWFKKESNQFLEIINNNEGTENENYENYKYFINKNFAIKSIAYGLIGEIIINKSSKNELSLYPHQFQLSKGNVLGLLDVWNVSYSQLNREFFQNGNRGRTA